jgi:hypothetical protein
LVGNKGRVESQRLGAVFEECQVEIKLVSRPKSGWRRSSLVERGLEKCQYGRLGAVGRVSRRCETGSVSVRSWEQGRRNARLIGLYCYRVVL